MKIITFLFAFTLALFTLRAETNFLSLPQEYSEVGPTDTNCYGFDCSTSEYCCVWYDPLGHMIFGCLAIGSPCGTGN